MPDETLEKKSPEDEAKPDETGAKKSDADKKEVEPEAKAAFLNVLFGGQKGEEKPKDGEDDEGDEGDEKKDGEEKKPEEKKDPDDKKPEEKLGDDSKKEPVKDSGLTGVKEAIAEGMKNVVEAVKETDKPKDEVDKKEDPDSDLSPKDRKKISVLEKMETMFDGQYKGITEKYRINAREQIAYIKKWKEDNPGETFVPDDSSHDAFYNKFDVKWDADDFVDAKVEIAVDKRTKNTDAREGKRIQKLESAERERGMTEEIKAVASTAITQTLEGIGEQFKIYAKDGVLESEAIKKFKEDDPDTHAIVIEAARTASAIAVEVKRLFSGLASLETGTDTKTGKSLNDIHIFIHNAAIEAEGKIRDGDAEGKIKSGKSFATSEQLQAMTPEESGNRWGIGVDEVVAMITQSFAEDAKKKVKNFEDQMERFAARKGFKKSDTEKSQKKEGDEKDDKKDGEANEDKGKPPSEPTSVETGNEKAVSPSKGEEPSNLTTREKFVDRLVSGQG